MPIMSESGSERSQGNSSIILAGYFESVGERPVDLGGVGHDARRPDLGDDLLAQLLALGLERLLQLLEAALAQGTVGRPVRLVEGRAGGGDGAAHVLGRRVGHLPQHLFGGRVDVLEALARTTPRRVRPR